MLTSRSGYSMTEDSSADRSAETTEEPEEPREGAALSTTAGTDDDFGGWADEAPVPTDDDADLQPTESEEPAPDVEAAAEWARAVPEEDSAEPEEEKTSRPESRRASGERRGPRPAETRPRVRNTPVNPKRASNSRRAGTGAAERRKSSAGTLNPLLQSVQSLGSSMQALTNRMVRLEDNMQKIARAMMEVVKEGQNRKKAYDVLYEELRQYKEDFLWHSQKPLFMELLGILE